MPIAPVAASAQTMFADLIQLSLDASFVEDFLEQGNFHAYPVTTHNH